MNREQLARATTSSDLRWDDAREKDIDTITALGIIQLRDSRMLRLGRLLILLRGYEETKSKTDLRDRMVSDREDAKALLSVLIHTEGTRKDKKMSRAAVFRTANAAYIEFVFDRCHQCRGAGSIVREEGGNLTCDACNGTGKHRFSDLERSLNIGCPVEKVPIYGDGLYFAIGLCGTAERLAVSAAADALGRWVK